MNLWYGEVAESIVVQLGKDDLPFRIWDTPAILAFTVLSGGCADWAGQTSPQRRSTDSECFACCTLWRFGNESERNGHRSLPVFSGLSSSLKSPWAFF